MELYRGEAAPQRTRLNFKPKQYYYQKKPSQTVHYHHLQPLQTASGKLISILLSPFPAASPFLAASSN